eukprot:TRINITY_DN28544_c0_g1_i3.p1 TRINITY_DN28544_c0_g1~~TRINITY_DN28544_c0_g1_i3.p1  ORF type:complete len:911 (-),score=170.62 TRINITY_DN28544_c0_g1_i3:229-2961(-)
MPAKLPETGPVKLGQSLTSPPESARSEHKNLFAEDLLCARSARSCGRCSFDEASKPRAKARRKATRPVYRKDVLHSDGASNDDVDPSPTSVGVNEELEIIPEVLSDHSSCASEPVDGSSADRAATESKLASTIKNGPTGRPLSKPSSNVIKVATSQSPADQRLTMPPLPAPDKPAAVHCDSTIDPPPFTMQELQSVMFSGLHALHRDHRQKLQQLAELSADIEEMFRTREACASSLVTATLNSKRPEEATPWIRSFDALGLLTAPNRRLLLGDKPPEVPIQLPGSPDMEENAPITEERRASMAEAGVQTMASEEPRDVHAAGAKVQPDEWLSVCEDETTDTQLPQDVEEQHQQPVEREICDAEAAGNSGKVQEGNCSEDGGGSLVSCSKFSADKGVTELAVKDPPPAATLLGPQVVGPQSMAATATPATTDRHSMLRRPSWEHQGARPSVFSNMAEALRSLRSLVRSPRKGAEISPSIETVPLNDDFKKALSNNGNTVERVRQLQTQQSMQMSKPLNLCGQLVASQMFEVLCGLVIVVNATYVGFQTQVEMQEAMTGESEPTNFVPTDCMWTLVFIAELILRFAAEGLVDFLIGDNSFWNWFDVCNVCTSIMDFMAVLLEIPLTAEVSVLRLARLARVLRILRMSGRIPVLKDLTTMLHSLTVSCGQIFPALLLFMLTVYIFGVAIMQGATRYILMEPSHSEAVVSSKTELSEYFGSLHLVFWTLVACVSGGHDWATVALPVQKVGIVYAVIFLLYIMFTVFALLNILTGVFVNASSQRSSWSREMATDEAVKEQLVFETQLWSMFQDADSSGDGVLDKVEFEGLMRCERNKALLFAMKLDFTCIERIFNLLDADGSGELDLPEFVESCIALRGEATALSVRFLQDDILKLTKKVDHLIDARSSKRRRDG